MQNLGYSEGSESDHELIWRKGNKILIELHKRIIPSYNKDYYAYFGDGWQLATQKTKGKNFAYEMDNMNKPITAPYAAKKCDISPDEAALALEMLTEIHVNRLTEVMLDENNSVRMYALNSDEFIMYLLMILKTARLIDENKQNYFNYRGSYNNLWIQ